MIGYSYYLSLTDKRKLEAAGCELIVSGKKELTEFESFKHFLAEYGHENIVLVSLESIGKKYTLLQLGTVITEIVERDISVQFIDLCLWDETEINHYYSVILALVERERAASRQRVIDGLDRVRKKGVQQGRPPVDQGIITSIRQCYEKERMSMRAIADKFNVSVGTVHKYSKEL
ncbi:recombinase family protein [Vagococcus sp. BWB3-3]|uniref:Recombinase family protein n=1 Tax=Vagococcus allomyrinae TaxID=2794353 RepID=A0A940PAX3_9ENTE|nr:winged helix-turn-helix transcriptional regulator [Vagococcus allomyrinae]MBP1040086.1 recombinase family protein [Vagococcus allomyrinae]